MTRNDIADRRRGGSVAPVKPFGRIPLVCLGGLAGLAIVWGPARSGAQQPYDYPFRNPALRPEERAANILSLMTVDEKIAGLGNPALQRLRIPGYGTAEGIHQSEEHTS